MGKRSRKRGGEIAAAPPAPAPAQERARPAGDRATGSRAARDERPRATRAARDERPRATRAARDERPRAPWHPFPLVELCVLIGLILLIAGLVRWDAPGGREMLVGGMLLASLGGLDTALREHFGGFRSHALLLAALPAVALAGILFFAGVPWIAIPIAAALTLAAGFVALRRAFRSHS